MATREEKAHRKQLQREATSPGKCQCLNAPRTLDDEFVGYAQSVHSFYDHFGKGPTTRYPIRICSVCGKRYVDAPMTA